MTVSLGETSNGYSQNELAMTGHKKTKGSCLEIFRIGSPWKRALARSF